MTSFEQSTIRVHGWSMVNKYYGSYPMMVMFWYVIWLRISREICLTLIIFKAHKHLFTEVALR